ncbi:MAG: hypothetical protein IIA67_02370, partial [Planctomycetes bacterium]|nr:hypothetical protein [Planctomycetota bacterium]
MQFVSLPRCRRLLVQLLLSLCAVAIPLGAAAQVQPLPSVYRLVEERQRPRDRNLHVGWDEPEKEAQPIEFDPRPADYDEDWRWQT